MKKTIALLALAGLLSAATPTLAGGWYLMTPPIESHAPLLNAPMQEWNLAESFDTARECQNAKDDTAHDAAWEEKQGLAPHDMVLAYANGQCIGSDDRRLAR